MALRAHPWIGSRRVQWRCLLRATAGDDFLGVQTYTRMLIGPDGWVGPEPGVEVLPMGYELWPAALGACLRQAWSVTDGQLPLWVTENGIGTDDDRQRIEFVRASLESVLGCLADGVRVDGYTYWSLLDTSNGRSDTDRASAWSRWTGRPSNADTEAQRVVVRGGGSNRATALIGYPPDPWRARRDPVRSLFGPDECVRLS